MLRKLLFVLSSLLSMLVMSAVEAQNNDKVCFTMKEMQDMIHLDPNSTEIMSMLLMKGFEIMYDNDMFRDTNNGVVLSYERTFFYNRNDEKSIIKIGKSKDGLSCNLLQMELYISECSMKESLRENFTMESDNITFHGIGIYKNKGEKYDAKCYEDTTFVNLTMLVADEVEKYVKHTISKNEKTLSNILQEIEKLSKEHKYVSAMSVMDSAKKELPFMQSKMIEKEMQVKNNLTNYYLEQINTSITDISLCIRYCDTIQLLNPNDSIPKIRKMLENQANGKNTPWSDFYPRQYSTIASSLENILNTAIQENRKLDSPTLTLDFRFKTDRDNKSNGTISLKQNTKSKRKLAKNLKLNEKLQTKIDSIATSPLIVPAYKYSINIATEENILANIKWNYDTKTVSDTSSSPLYKPLVKDIIDSFFVTRDTAMVSFEDNHDTIYVHTHKPTKMEFEFGITEKTFNGKKYTDVELVQFHTTDITSWMPSLFIPGLGTQNIKNTSAIGKALPFFLFGAISVAGFSWEMNGGKKVERPTLAEGKAETKIWEYKNFGYIVGTIGAAISATIYIEDIAEGLSSCIRNLRYSKKLRRQLKEGPILIKSEEIKLVQ